MQRLGFTRLLSILALVIPLAAGADCMGPYPPSMVKAFNQSCAKDPQQQSFCSCLINEVQRNIPLAEFIEIGNSATGIYGDARFIAASKKCSPQLTDAPAAAQPAPMPAPASTASPRVPGGNSAAGATSR